VLYWSVVRGRGRALRADALRGHYEWRKVHTDIAVIVLAAADNSDDILAVGAHELDPQVAQDGHHLEGTYLTVAAVRRDLQGREVKYRAV
jgi:hypothetical protein